MSNDIITIDTAVGSQVGKGTKWVYHDTTGKRWVSWDDKVVLIKGRTYEIQEFKPNQWSPKSEPEKKFTDYVITKAKEVAAPSLQEAAAISSARAMSQTNGNAKPVNGRQKWDKDEVLSARLSLIIGGWAESGQIALDATSVARALWALDEGKRLYETGTPSVARTREPVALDSEDPSDGMEGTEFGR